MKKKIVIVGAASAVFGVKMLRDISLTPEMDGSELVLVDISEGDLDIVHGLAKRLLEHQEREVKLSCTSSREQALPGADFVILSVAVNKNPLWKLEFEVPIKHGMSHTLGENGGLGGVFHSLRSINVVMPIIHDVERLCPNAFVLNYTNPMSRVCMAIDKLTSVKTIGLCHELLHKLSRLAELMSIPRSEIEVLSAGLNHIPFILELRRKNTGEDLYPLLCEKLPRSGENAMHLCNFLLDRLGYLPGTDDRHLGEYLSFATEYCEPRPAHLFSSGAKWRDDRLALFGRIARGEEDFEDDMLTKSDERAIDIILSIGNDSNALEEAVNIPNNGLISNLPQDAIIEGPARFGKDGAAGMSVGNLPEQIAALLKPQVDVQRMIVEAYAKQSRDLALQAILIDPAIPKSRAAEEAFDELLELEAEYLPKLK